MQWHRANCWLYGAVEIPTGQSLFYNFSHLDAVCFQRFLEQLAQQFPTSFNLLQLDRAGAHVATQLQWPSNVLPVFQPPASPELNPVERLWQELRKRFRGRNFATLPDTNSRGLCTRFQPPKLPQYGSHILWKACIHCSNW